MANATALQFGAVNSAGARDAMFLKVFGGEVMTAFAEMNEILDKHMVRSISSGKSAQFPAMWKVNAAYHTVGAEIVGQNSNVNERTITIDDLLISDVFIAKIEEAKSHYDVRAPYSTEVGSALRRRFNANVMQVAILAARAAATVTGGFGGSALTNAAYATDGATIAAGVFAAAQALDEKDVPENDRYVFLKPAQYALVAQTTNVLNRDWGGSGVYSDGSVLKVAGVSFVKSNNLPSTNVTTGPAAYQGNFTNVRGLVMQKGAVGTVKLMDLAVEMEWDIRRQGTLLVAKYAMGHGVLRPECAVEMKVA
jgi:hypothetical protein